MSQSVDHYEHGAGEKRIANARWMHPNEAADRYPFLPGAFWIGRSPIDDENAIGFDDDRHILLVAGTRSGKGRACIINNLVHWPGSIVSIDPKGENATLTARRRGTGSEFCTGLGQEVYVLDPFGTTDPARITETMRAYYNPLADMDAHDPELPRFAARIAESMMLNVNKNDPSWDKKGGSMIEALIMHVKTSPDFEEKDRNLVTVRRLLMAGDRKAYDTLKSMGVEELPTAIELLWQAVIDNPAYDGILSDMGHSFLHSSRMNARYFDSVKTSAEDQTKWIDSQGMREILCGSDRITRTFSMDDLKNHPQGISVFLCLPQADMATYARWQRMMVDLLVAAMQKTQTRPRNGHRVLFSLDEFAGLGKMDRMRSAAAEIAGAGVKLLIAVQGLNQLEEIYEKGWETFVGNAGLQLYFDLRDNFTLDYVQRALGEAEVIRTTETQSQAVSRQTTVGTSEGRTTGTSTTTTKGGFTGWNKSRSYGTSRNWGRNWGSSKGTSFGPHLFFSFEHSSHFGSQKGGSVGGGSTWQRSYGTSGGENFSTSTGETEQAQFIRQQSESTGSTTTTGTSQSVHKKHLLTFDEANTLLARIDDPDHIAYPGLILVRIAGQDPILVRRVNYDQDPAFVGCFDPHPDHPFIPYEKPQAIEPPKQKPTRWVIPNRQFVEGSHPAAEDIEIIQNFDEYTYTARRSFPFDAPDIWKVLTYSELWSIWMSGRGYYFTPFQGLPDRFGAGSVVNGNEHGHSARVVAGQNGKKLTVRWFCGINEILFLTMTLDPGVRSATNVVLEARYFYEPKKGITGLLSRKKLDSDDIKSECQGYANQLLKAFENECFDVLNYGRSVSVIEKKSRKAYWRTWTLREGTFYVFPDQNGNRSLEIGQAFGPGAKLGYVYNPQDHPSEQFAMEQNYVDLHQGGVLRDIRKSHGERVETGDRIFLIEAT